ncbi:hypothetical protein [Puia dinghuensis]|nr:hypothetical protein [Puia dinghuensis]
MSTKIVLIGAVSVLGVGAALHHAHYCPLQHMLTAMHQKKATTAVAKTVTPPAAKNAVAMK